MTSRRNTIQKDLVRNTVYEMRRHVTANEVYEFIKEAYPSIGKGTVYRNLDILVEEGALRKVEVPNGPNRFDFTLKNHYHVRCIKCGEIFDVDMDQIPDLLERIHNTHGIEFVDYDISFKGICPKCRENVISFGIAIWFVYPELVAENGIEIKSAGEGFRGETFSQFKAPRHIILF